MVENLIIRLYNKTDKTKEANTQSKNNLYCLFFWYYQFNLRQKEMLIYALILINIPNVAMQILYSWFPPYWDAI